MIIAQKIHFTYPPLRADLPAHPVLRDVSLMVPFGDALAVMGASGSGKSTLCHLLAGLIPHYSGGTFSGAIHIANYDVRAAAPPIGAVGILFQDATTQLFNDSAEDEVAWGLEAMGIPPGKIGTQVEQALARFGLLEARRRPPWALSGGQQKRLALASIWAMRPRVLLLDEPLGGLDPVGRVEVLDAMDILRQGGTTVLLTTLRPQCARFAPNAVLLQQGESQCSTPTEKVLAHEADLVSSGVLYPPHIWPDFGKADLRDAPSAIDLDAVDFSYPDGRPVLHDISLQIPQGQFVAVVGTNGAGKSTLVRHFNGLLSPAQGSVRILGQPTVKRPVGKLARQVGFLFQRPEQQFFGTTVREEVAYGVKQLRLSDSETRVEAALCRFGLEYLADLPPAILSYGMQRAVTLASLAALDSPILVLDEPSVGLDGHGWAQLLTWLVERRAAGVTLILVTHEMALAARADRVIALEAGRVITDGKPDVVLPGLPLTVVA